MLRFFARRQSKFTVPVCSFFQEVEQSFSVFFHIFTLAEKIYFATKSFYLSLLPYHHLSLHIDYH